MPSPPIDLNVQIAHEPILQSFDIPVKPHLPATIVCPVCSQESMCIYVAPGTGGRWYMCRSCGFRGDSIELYQTGHTIGSIESTIYELINRHILPGSTNEITHQIIGEYERSYILRRKALRTFFEKASQRIVDVSQPILDLLQYHKLWSGYSSDWSKTLGAYIGGASDKDLAEVGLLPPGDKHHVLVCPFYDVPGRLSSMLLISYETQSRILLNSAFNDNEHGLMMLDTVKPADPVVIATDNPIFALHLQRKNFVTGSAPLPIVVYSDSTDRAWSSVCSNRVIFWQNTFSYELFKQSRQHARAHIATRPTSDNFRELLRVKSLPFILNELSTSAISWAEAMKTYILNGENRGSICDTVHQLELTAYELNKIYELCTNNERELIKQILGEKPIEQHIFIQSMKIIDADGAWWIDTKGHRELGCNAIIKIDRAVHAKDSGSDMYEGTISANGKTVSFKDEIQYVDLHTTLWLTKHMMAGGLGIPIVQARLKRHILEISKQLYPPMYAQGYSRIGWYPEDQTFVFPNFGIRDGRLDNAACAYGTNNDVPAVNIGIEPLSYGEWDLALVDTPENAALWAGLACFMSNMLAPVIGTSHRMIGMVGSRGSIAHIVGVHLADELGMFSMDVGNVFRSTSKSVCAKVAERTVKHGYPIWLNFEVNNYKFLACTKFDEAYNVMMQMPENMAMVLYVNDLWTFVYAPAVMAQRNSLPKLKGIMRYLAWLQSAGFKLPAATNVVWSVLESLSAWADDELHALDRSVFQSASKLLRTSDMAGVDQRLLRLIYWLQETNNLAIGHAALYDDQHKPIQPDTRAFLTIDDTAEKVYINDAVFIRLLKLLPKLDTTAATRELAANSNTNGFESRDNGFILSLNYWNTEVKKYKQASYW